MGRPPALLFGTAFACCTGWCTLLQRHFAPRQAGSAALHPLMQYEGLELMPGAMGFSAASIPLGGGAQVASVAGWSSGRWAPRYTMYYILGFRGARCKNN